MKLDVQHLDYQEAGFGAFYAPPNPPGGHTHEAFEISMIEGGQVTMLYGGEPVRFSPGQWALHWGMLPHQVHHRDPGALVAGLHIPLAWMLEWTLPENLLSRLLDMELIMEPAQANDLQQIKDWFRLLDENITHAVDIVQLEARARLLRVGAYRPPRKARIIPPPSPGPFHRALRHIIRHFREPIRLADIAAAAGISPRHLTRTFLEFTGQTVNTYITHLRLSHARRLLSTTDLKVLDVMHDAGFSCATHFYRLFHDQTGLSPCRYRRQVRV